MLAAAHDDDAEGARLLTSLDRIKRLLWHGNQHRALETIGFFEDDVGALEVDYPNLGKFARATHEFAVYIASNTGSLINYGERYRGRPAHFLMPGRIHGERCDQQTFCQASTDAMGTARGASAVADANTRPRQYAAASLRALVSRPCQRQRC